MDDPYEDRVMPVDQTIPAHPLEAGLMSDQGSFQPPVVDFYSILNVSRTASNSELQDAFNKLSQIFHPDHQTDAELKETAESKFRIIKRAFDVLSNPQLRSTYDKHGEEGLDSKFDVGHKITTPQEQLEEYARLARETQDMTLENLVRSRNNIVVHVDASNVFHHYEMPASLRGGNIKQKSQTETVMDSLGRTKIMQLFMKNTFETRIGNRTNIVLGGSMSSSSGTGSGSVMGTLRHTFSDKISMELGASLLNPTASIIKGNYNIDPLTFVSAVAELKSSYGPAPLVLTVGRTLVRGTTGYVTYRTGEWALGSWGRAFEDRDQFSSMTMGLRSSNENEHYQAEVQAGVVQSRISLDRTWTLDESTRVRVGLGYSSLAGAVGSIGGDRQVTEYTRLGLAAEVGLGGVAFNFKVTRLGQSVTVPILLSTEFDPKIAFWATVAPVSALTALDLGYIKPKRRRERAQKLQELRKVHADFIASQRREAEEAITLLRESTLRKTKLEQDKDGLVIIEATYGNLSAGLVADVTIAVQALVNNSQLAMPGGHSKNHVLGFYDPCLGEKKQLRIRYEFQKKLHEVVVADMAAVVAPVREHIVNP
ncbi:DnaJ homolog subfamily C member 11 [Entomortierella parvispora]|uniref:DnaJ homolog subfamily C member 11 n=1 Tax=Entomortierella parvispora TaxID=205924 RepID=A0A9P3HI93_9FUNG|nr:DnaJ homolog subfamily C member 11 [Entomortierella parvispora]